jgi:hypothetical protein
MIDGRFRDRIRLVSLCRSYGAWAHLRRSYKHGAGSGAFLRVVEFCNRSELFFPILLVAGCGLKSALRRVTTVFSW